MERTVIALGFFDGIHKGHGAVLQKTVERSEELQATACVYTFDCPPRQVVTGETVPLINSSMDRQTLIANLFGIRQVIFDHFDEAIMHMPWDQFLEDVLVKKYHAVHLVAGHDYHFGSKNKGTPELLVQKCKELGIGCDIVPAVLLHQERVSSTLIRSMLERGELDKANEYLGHPYSMSGTIEHGQALGRTMDLPTINFPLPENIIVPRLGVYVSKVYLVDGSVYQGITNIGKRPTVSSSDKVNVETFLLDFEGDLYGQRVWLEFIRFIRPEQRFSSLMQLREQIDRDLASLYE